MYHESYYAAFVIDLVGYICPMMRMEMTATNTSSQEQRGSRLPSRPTITAMIQQWAVQRISQHGAIATDKLIDGRQCWAGFDSTSLHVLVVASNSETVTIS